MNRYLIVNADDFGQSEGVNKGIIHAHEQGIVTSASLMTRGVAAVEAAAYGRTNPGFGLGLHIDLGEWIYRNEKWMPLYEVVPTGDKEAVAAEVQRQLETFRRLVGQEPTHLDSHQHAHRHEPVRSILDAVAQALQIPLRHFSAVVRYCGDFYGQTRMGDSFPEGISVAMLSKILAGLPAGVTELGCHPGYADDLNSMYRDERLMEVNTLCDPSIRAVIEAEQIRLCSFGDIARAAK